MINALSVDLEDWYQAIGEIDCRDWDKFEDRILQNTQKVLFILQKYDIKATFFTLGFVAERYPALVNSVYNAGHEIAAHGYFHTLIYKQTKEEFKSDVLKTKQLLEQIIQTKVEGYRAPFFSINEKTLWVFDVLEKIGFKYDSSVFPTKNPYYGMPGWHRFISRVGNGRLVQFPLSTRKIFGVNIPIAGGFYLRCLPTRFICSSIERLNRKGHPAVLYFHPWELDPEKPRVKLSMMGRMIWEYNIKGMEEKLRFLLTRFDFAPIKDVLKERKYL